MTTNSSILAWDIPWTEECGGLQSMESQSRTQLSKKTNYNVYVQLIHSAIQQKLTQHCKTILL